MTTLYGPKVLSVRNGIASFEKLCPGCGLVFAGEKPLDDIGMESTTMMSCKECEKFFLSVEDISPPYFGE